jgi:hypothetical protein
MAKSTQPMFLEIVECDFDDFFASAAVIVGSESCCMADIGNREAIVLNVTCAPASVPEPASTKATELVTMSTSEIRLESATIFFAATAARGGKSGD